jgi:hypothetical protein
VAAAQHVRAVARRITSATRLDMLRIQGLTAGALADEVGAQVDDFHRHIDHLTSELTIKANVLRLKLRAYANWFDRSQILQFAAASCIALAAAVQALLGEYLTSTLGPDSYAEAAGLFVLANNTLTPAITFGFNMFILLVSSGAGFMTLIVKFRGWKEKADDMNSVYRRSMDVVKDLPSVQHRLRRCTTSAEIEDLKEAFDEREFKFFRETVQDINDHLGFDAHTSHLPGFYAINLQHKRDQLEYTKQLNALVLEERGMQKKMYDDMVAADPRSSLLFDDGHSSDHDNYDNYANEDDGKVVGSRHGFRDDGTSYEECEEGEEGPGYEGGTSHDFVGRRDGGDGDVIDRATTFGPRTPQNTSTGRAIRESRAIRASAIRASTHSGMRQHPTQLDV